MNRDVRPVGCLQPSSSCCSGSWRSRVSTPRRVVRGGDRVDCAGDRVVGDRGRGDRRRRRGRVAELPPGRHQQAGRAGVPGRHAADDRHRVDDGLGRFAELWSLARLHLRREGIAGEGRRVHLYRSGHWARGGRADGRPVRHPGAGPLSEGSEEVQRPRRGRAVQHQQQRRRLRRHLVDSGPDAPAAG